MSTKIHHGAPGSYKSSGAVQDDLIPALVEGRTIVSNIRGLTEERVLTALEKNENVKLIQKIKNPKVIYVDTDTKAGRDKMARWFHWAPKDAYIFIDEAQRIYPKRWTQRQMAELDFPGGPEAAEAEERPPTFEDSFDMQRHHNWDLCLTTPHIKKIRDDIRQAAERAYKHKNKALLGNLPLFKGRYLEGDHPPDDNGNASSLSTITDKRIKKYVFDFYDSTTTGKHNDTKAGQSIFKNTRLLLALAVATGCLGYAGYRYLFGGGVIQTTQTVDQIQTGSDNSQISQATDIKTTPPPAYPLADQPPDRSNPLIPLSGQRIDIVGYIKGAKHYYAFAVEKENTWTRLNSDHLYNMGFQINSLGSCAAIITYKEQKRLITCGARSKAYFSSLNNDGSSRQTRNTDTET